jgi:hypothetical protein
MSPSASLPLSDRTRNPTARSSPRPALPVLAGEVARALYQHRVATTGQLQQLLVPHTADASYLRRVLRATTAAGLVDAVPFGSAGHRAWFLTGAGYQTVEASGQVEIRAHRMTRALAAGGLLAHRLAVVDVGAVFVAAAGRVPGDVCTPWSWAPEVLLQPGRRGGVLIADAVLHYERADGTGYRWLIEVDRGTYPVPRLAAKLGAYARWWAGPQSRAWRDARLLIVVDMPTAAAARRITALARQAWAVPQLRRSGFGRLPVGAVGYDALAAAGPWAPVVTDVLTEDLALTDTALDR